MTTTVTLKTASTIREVIECLADIKEYPLSDNRIQAHLGVLGKIPLQHVKRAAGELLKRMKWMPQPSELHEEAIYWWDREERKAQEERPRLGYHEARITSEDFRAGIQQYGGEMAKAILDGMDRIGQPKKFRQAMDWEAVNKEMDENMARRLAQLTPEQRKEREAYLRVLHGPQKTFAQAGLPFCDGCGKTMRDGRKQGKGDRRVKRGYRGPAPQFADVQLCVECSEEYSWANEKEETETAA